MWVVVGALLGVTVVAILAGFHAGPHAHVVAAATGVLAAIFLVVMACTGQTAPLLFVLLGVDLSLSAAVGYGAWRSFATIAAPAGHGIGSVAARSGLPGIEASMGTALTILNPNGIVRVQGEEWSAVSVNGTIAIGSAVQVLEVDGIRLRVWGEEAADVGFGSAAGGEPDSAERAT